MNTYYQNYNWNPTRNNFNNSGVHVCKTDSPLDDFRGMKWHKFLIYFSLWLNGILNLLMGAGCFLMLGKGYYGVSIEELLVSGVLSVICGIYAIVTRFKLANFRDSAIECLMGFLILTLISNIIIGVTGGTFSLFSLFTIVGTIIYISLNYSYYNNRRDLFVF